MRSQENPGRDCIRAWESMPWVLQGSAAPMQDEWLKNHLEHCAACRVEFEQQTRLRLAMSLLPDIPVDANAGLVRLMHRIDASDPQRQPVRRRSRWLVRALVAAVTIQVLGIGALGTAWWRANTAAPYRTLSQPSAPVAPGSIRVVPDPATTMADWDALLHSLRLRVVNGPNSIGAYTVAPIDGTTSTRQSLQKLRAAPGISFAEPLGGAP